MWHTFNRRISFITKWYGTGLPTFKMRPNFSLPKICLNCFFEWSFDTFQPNTQHSHSFFFLFFSSFFFFFFFLFSFFFFPFASSFFSIFFLHKKVSPMLPLKHFQCPLCLFLSVSVSVCLSLSLWHTHTNMHIFSLPLSLSHTCTQAYTFNSLSHTHTHTHTHTYARTLTHTLSQTHKYMHSVHAHAHTSLLTLKSTELFLHCNRSQTATRLERQTRRGPCVDGLRAAVFLGRCCADWNIGCAPSSHPQWSPAPPAHTCQPVGSKTTDLCLHVCLVQQEDGSQFAN